MNPWRWDDRVTAIAALVVPAVLAAALIPVRDAVGNTNVALVLMAVVVVIRHDRPVAGRRGSGRVGGAVVRLLSHREIVGDLVLTPAPGVPVPEDRLFTAAALAGEVGAGRTS